MTEREQLEQAIAHLETQRAVLGDAVVDASVAALHEKLAALTPSHATEQRRKHVTLLFADISGFTAMSESMDAEDVGDMMNALWQRLDRNIVEQGGRIDKHTGDGVMAVWGVEAGREDDPERAIRAALEMQSGLASFSTGRGMRLSLRIGINSGPVFLGRVGTTNEYTALGDTVNTARRLEQAAPRGGVLISHDTYRHVRGVFDVQALDPVQAKGKREPIQVYRVRRAKPRVFRMGTRGVEGIETRMIGRGRELEQLQEALRTAMYAGKRRLITILGDAGVGKSRLLYEFENWLELLPERIFYFKGRASLEMQHIPYALIRDMFSYRFQIQESDPNQVLRSKIERGVGEALGQTQTPVRAHFIGHLLGFDFSKSPHLQGIVQQGKTVDAQQLRDRALIYLGDYFQAVTEQQPTVILLEDLHWADDSSLDIIRHMARSLADQRLLILCLARPSLIERRPHWLEPLTPTGMLKGVEPEIEQHLPLDLRPLSRQDSHDLVQEILQKVKEIPVALQELVVDGAEGNPFYIEELIKMLIEDGVIVKGEEQWHVEPTRLTTVRVPPTLTGILQARLDSLPRDERIILQQASVVGRVFWDSIVARISASGREDAAEEDILGILYALGQHEMIFRREKSAFAQAHEYIFKHAILRQVTYESVLKRVRRVYHALVADWLIEHSGERAGEYIGLIADHLELAGKTEQACTYLRRAGEQAATQFATAEAVRYLGRALDLLQGDHPEVLAQRYALLLTREKVYSLQSEHQAQEQDLQVLEKLAEALTPTTPPAEGETPPGTQPQTICRRAEVALRRANYAEQSGDFAMASAKIQHAIDLTHQTPARDARDDAERAYLRATGYLQWGRVLWRQGDYEPARVRIGQALEIVRGGRTEQTATPGTAGDIARSRALEADSLRNLGNVCWYLGEYEEAKSYYQQALRIYHETGDRRGEGASLNNLGNVASKQRDHAASRHYYQQSLRIDREIGNRRGTSASLSNLGSVSMGLGDYDRARRYIEEALQINRESGSRHGVGSSINNLGIIFDQLGDYEAARACFEQALQIRMEIGERQGQAESLSDLGLLLHHVGNNETAREYGRQSLSMIQEIGDPFIQSYVLTRLGHALTALDELVEAAEVYRQALKLRQELGQPTQATEPIAGLARISLAQGEPRQALAQVEKILDYLEGGTLDNTDEPCQVYLTCYQTLQANGDPRAQDILTAAHSLLQKRAAMISEEKMRHSFLEHVAAHREIMAEFARRPDLP